MRALWILLLAGLAAGCSVDRGAARPGSGERVYDLVVYGGTSAGVIAAVQARRDGLSVALLCPETHLGGLSSSGLGWTDSGKKEVVGGLSRDFYHRIFLHYDNDAAWRWQERSAYGNRGQGAPAIDGDQRTMWIFEPHAAEAVFEKLVVEHEIHVFRDRWLDRKDGVRMEGKRIMSIDTLGGERFWGRAFIDATYEGDLMAAAGVTYTVGRESNETYGETLNGNQPNPRSHNFTNKVSGYVVPGDPTSGLLPRIQPGGEGERGAGDRRVQAYNYRMCLTQVEANRVPFSKPEGYDPLQYELLLRDLLAGSRHVFGKFDPIPNAKTDTNNHGSFSTDNIGMNWDYPEASYARRKEILDEHRRYQMGYFYFLCNDPRVPADVRQRMSQWGLAKDEFEDNDHWPRQIYVREARRMVGDFVVTEPHLRRQKPTPRPIGMGSYNMDSHNVRRYIDKDGFVHNEGDVQVNPGGPYPIDYGAVVPKKGECENLLVPVAVSSSHIAYGSIRMEPVFMVLGQSCAQAAKLALERGVSMQDVPYDMLRERLISAGQVLEYSTRTAIKQLDGLVIDDTQAQLLGSWQTSSSVNGYIGQGYRHDGDARDGKFAARFEGGQPLPAGRYTVRLSYTPNPNRSTKTVVTVIDSEGQHIQTVNQQVSPGSDGFISLGSFRYDGKTRPAVVVTNTDADGYVIIDAAQWLKVEP